MTVTIANPRKPERRLRPKLGDILWKGEKYLTRLPPETYDPVANGVSIIRLGNFDPNPFYGLKALGIGLRGLDSRYRCPYTQYEHWGILPLAVATRDLQKYQERLKGKFRADYALDFEFHWGMSHPEEYPKPLHHFLTMNRIQHVMMGSGYTEGTLAYDGHGQKCLAGVMLDNDDWLVVCFWLWFNR